MAETDVIAKETKERIERVGAADIVIGLPACGSADALHLAVEYAGAALPAIADGLKAVVLYPDSVLPASSAETEPANPAAALQLVPVPWLPPDRLPSVAQKESNAFQEVFRVSQKVAARACCVWNSAADRITPAAVRGLLEPILARDLDLAVARYTRPKFGGLIISSIVYPLARALYGRRIYDPMSADLGFSPRFVEILLQPSPQTGRPRALEWIPIQAVSAGLKICQVNLGLHPAPAQETADLSSVLVQVLGPLFLDVERNAPLWQKARGSQSVPTFGEEVPMSEERGAGDVQRMLDTFQLGYRNLQEIWGVVLPPATLLELKKLTRTAPEQFRLPDDVWARIVYDFALGHRQRAISRDHLLRAMTPLYLAWVVSYALEVRDAPAQQTNDRLERLALAYETQKPYLLSRWRWPDRFNP